MTVLKARLTTKLTHTRLSFSFLYIFFNHVYNVFAQYFHILHLLKWKTHNGWKSDFLFWNKICLVSKRIAGIDILLPPCTKKKKIPPMSKKTRRKRKTHRKLIKPVIPVRIRNFLLSSGFVLVATLTTYVSHDFSFIKMCPLRNHPSSLH